MVTHLLMDGPFDPLRVDLAKMGIELNVVSNEEHVPEIERQIHMVMECMQAISNTCPINSSLKWYMLPTIGSICPMT